MLSIDLKPVMLAKGLKRMYTTLVKAGVPPTSAKALANGGIRRVPLDHLETICLLLRCSPNDVLRWTPSAGQSAEGQPLAELRADNDKGLAWLAGLQGMSVEELRALGEKLQGAAE